MDNPVITTTYEKECEIVAKVILDKSTTVVDFSNLAYYEEELRKSLGKDFTGHKTYLQLDGAKEYGKNARVAICMEGHYIGS